MVDDSASFPYSSQSDDDVVSQSVVSERARERTAKLLDRPSFRSAVPRSEFWNGSAALEFRISSMRKELKYLNRARAAPSSDPIRCIKSWMVNYVHWKLFIESPLLIKLNLAMDMESPHQSPKNFCWLIIISYFVIKSFTYRTNCNGPQYTGWHVRLRPIFRWHQFGEFPWPAWAVASCSSGPQAGETPQIDVNEI